MGRDRRAAIPLLPRFLLPAGGFLVGFLAFEVACRLLAIDFNPNPNWRFHPLLGWTQATSRDFLLDVAGEQIRVEFNARGFRDVEHELQKAPGVNRVVVVGDSFSEALQVNLEDTYYSHLGKLLSGDRQGSWEVINLGVGDYGSAQAFLALTELGLEYSPDLVLFQIFPLNDICNNSIRLANLCKSQNDRYRPYFVQTGGDLRLRRSDPLRHWLRSNIYSVGVLERAYLSTFEPRVVDEDLHRARYAERGIPAEPLLYTYASDDEQIDEIAEGWRITEAILRRVDEICRRHSVPWLPVVVPFEARLTSVWHRFRSGPQIVALERDYPEKRLGKLFDSLDVPALFLLESFDENQSLVLPYIDGHLNKAAHALVAQEAYDLIVNSSLRTP